MEGILTKSLYLSGIQCSKKLWREVNKPDSVPSPDTALLQRFEVGRQVGEIARQCYPDGILVTADSRTAMLEMTRSLIESDVPAIFEGAFEFEGVYIRVDILKKNNDGTWDLIEVKSGTGVKDEYLDDASIQCATLKGAGIRIKQVHIQHINNKCEYPNLDDLLIEEDVTAKVLGMQIDVRGRIADFQKMLEGDEPQVSIGEHCEKPYECPFKEECWKIVPDCSIFEINGLQWKKKNDLIGKGILAVSELPASAKLSDKQSAIAKRITAGVPVIDKRSIERELSALKYPLRFFDFETDNPAVPRFDGCKPYQQFPFQFSLHTLFEDGRLEHSEYLHTDMSDPRRIVAERMLEFLLTSGSIICYNATFEKTRIKELASAFPELEYGLLALNERMFDQLIIFRDHYFHPAFKGSNSIKSVLPILVPALSYQALDHVHDGTEAGAIWNKALVEREEAVREKYFQALKAYCRLDTLAMVKLHQHLVQLT